MRILPDVVLYLCQPWTLTISVVDTKGRSLPIQTTVDFLLLDSRGFRFIECKDIAEIRRRAASKYPRFVCVDGRWRWPAAEKAAAALGLGFELFTSQQVNPIWLRNMRFLADYIDVPSPLDPKQLNRIIARLKQEGSIRISDLLASDQVPPAVLWWLLAQKRLWCDFENQRLFETDQAWVHHTELRMLAHRRSNSTGDTSLPITSLNPIILEPGAQFSWDHVPWTVLNRGAQSVTLQRASASGVATLSLTEADSLIRSGAWQADDSALQDVLSDARTRILRRATDRDLAEAKRRVHVVEYFQRRGHYPADVNPRVARRYVHWYNDGEQRYGSGFCGLIRFRGRPPGISRLSMEQQEVLEEVVAQLSTKQKTGRVSAAHNRVVTLCQQRGITPPSEETVRRRLKQNSIPDDKRIRSGSRAAYQCEGPLPQTAATPRHGDRAWEIGHIDHTPLDIRLVSSKTHTLLGTPWLTTYLDAYSRLPIAFGLSFDGPSRTSVAAVLFDCIRRNHRLSDTLVVDQASEFNSLQIEDLLGDRHMDKLERPTAKSRYGAVVERMFGTTNTAFIHELTGNTTLLSLGRGLSSSHHPNRSAVWTLPLLHDILEQWLFTVYATRTHSTLGDSPRAVFDRSVALSGERLARYIADDDGTRVLLAQAAPGGGTRKVHPVRGVVVDYLPYWHDDFQYGDVVGTTVPVKIDVATCSAVFAYVRKQWVSCRLTAGDADLHGRSWRQVRLAIDVLRQQRRLGRAARPLNAARIGEFLLKNDNQGVALQAARDAEARQRSPSLACRGKPQSTSPTQGDTHSASHADALPATLTHPTGRTMEQVSPTDEPHYDHLETFDAR